MALSDDFSERRPYNAVSDFVDANVARGLGNKIAFIDPDRSLTYDDLQARSIRFANALHELGVEHEQRVALLLNDTVDYPVAFWGTIRAGSVAVPLNTYLPLPQYAYILADCRATALVVAAPLAQTIWPVINKLPRLKTIIIVGATDPTWPDFTAARCMRSTTSSPTPMRRPSPPTLCPTKSHSGCTPPARPETPRASNTSTPT